MVQFLRERVATLLAENSFEWIPQTTEQFLAVMELFFKEWRGYNLRAAYPKGYGRGEYEGAEVAARERDTNELRERPGGAGRGYPLFRTAKLRPFSGDNADTLRLRCRCQ